MVNLGICRKCSEGQYLPIHRDKNGRLVSLPSICCRMGGLSETLFLGWDSEPPDKCIYLVEQKMTEEESWEENESMMEEVCDPEAINEH